MTGLTAPHPRWSGPRSAAPVTRLAATLMAALIGSAACTSTDSSSPAGSDPADTSTGTPAPTLTRSTTEDRSTAGRPSNERSTVTTIRITVDGQTRTARLADNPTARDLVDQLPLTLRFRDHNRVEKNAKLPRLLTVDGAPAGIDPDINDLGYFAPTGDLVLYYGDAGYYDGIVRIGRFDDEGLDFIRGQADGFTVTIDQA
jgi:hypothetical protein